MAVLPVRSLAVRLCPLDAADRPFFFIGVDATSQQQPVLPPSGLLSRRTLVHAFALLGFPTVANGDGPAGLGAVAARAGLRFGSAMRASSLDDTGLTDLLRRECTSITPELEMKWAALAPARDAFDAGPADAIAAFARVNGMALRGHALLWHQSIPPWFRASDGWTPVERHIARTVGRYKGRAAEWDVINEPVAPDGSGLRRGALLHAFGPSYMERALRAARAADPRARLYINEYDLEYETGEQAKRRAALLSLVRSLHQRKAPLDGIGIQAHLAVGRGGFGAGLRDLLAAFADLGLRVAITELDVKERDYILPADRRDAHVADHAARFLEVALANRAVRSLTCWGLSDRQTWLEVTDEDRGRFPGAWADGSSPGFNRGLPFDSSLKPKPMRNAIAAALSRRGGRR